MCLMTVVLNEVTIQVTLYVAGHWVGIEWQAISHQLVRANSTRLKHKHVPDINLTIDGKVLAWSRYKPGTFFCHGRCSELWATVPCLKCWELLVDNDGPVHFLSYGSNSNIFITSQQDRLRWKETRQTLGWLNSAEVQFSLFCIL